MTECNDLELTNVWNTEINRLNMLALSTKQPRTNSTETILCDSSRRTELTG